MTRLEELKNDEHRLYFAYMECQDPNYTHELKWKLIEVQKEIEELEKQKK